MLQHCLLTGSPLNNAHPQFRISAYCLYFEGFLSFFNVLCSSFPPSV